MAEKRLILTRRWTLGALPAAAAALVAPVVWGRAQPRSETPVVAAASDLQFALEEIAGAFSRDTGLAVRLAFGSSGNLSRQIRQGAPFQLFLSADEDYVNELVRAGLTRDDGALYAVGRLAVIAAHRSPLKVDAALDDLARALDDGRVSRFAIANPEHAPYGRRAVEALRHRGLWATIEGKLVFGENVSQAAQFAVSANAQGGIVAHSLVRAPQVSAQVSHAELPAAWHTPLRQRMVLLRGAGATAERFYSYLQQPVARTLLDRHGFTLPKSAN